MRLSDVLSKPPSADERQVEGFLGSRRISWGKHKVIEAGRVVLNFYCDTCDDQRSHVSETKLSALMCGPNAISLDVALKCISCEGSRETWFLVESSQDIFAHTPSVRVSRRLESNRGCDTPRPSRQLQTLLDLANSAYCAGLGAGSMIYLRKVLESVTIQTAKSSGIPTTRAGRRTSFRALLEAVDGKHGIIPSKFSANGYQLFAELSEAIHGDSHESEALRKYPPCRELVLGVVGNVARNAEMASAIDALGWEKADVVELAAEATAS